MVVSLVSETEWIAALSDLPELNVSRAKTLVLAPHPDDETLAAGGLIAAQCSQGVEVIVVAITDGEMAYSDVSGVADVELGDTRREEQTKALLRLGVQAGNIVRFRLPDSDVVVHEQEIVERILPLVADGMQIIAPWPGDFHPDHEACGRAAREIALRTGATLIYWFFWTWHRGRPELLDGLDLRRFMLNEEQMRAKAEALACHCSQLVREGGEPVLPDDLLAPARRGFEVFLPG